jgi:probable phosphoglycerate mutase
MSERASAKAGPASGPAFAAQRLPDDVRLWLIRHGETEWSASGRHTGRTDLPLTSRGEDQARALRPLLADLAPTLETRPDWTLWRDGVENGETIDQVAARADRVLTRVTDALTHGPVVLVAHGHISRVLGARWICLPASAGANLLLGTAAPSLLSTQYGSPVIAHWNLPNPASAEGIAS